MCLKSPGDKLDVFLIRYGDEKKSMMPICLLAFSMMSQWHCNRKLLLIRPLISQGSRLMGRITILWMILSQSSSNVPRRTRGLHLRHPSEQQVDR
jgi:hypothetical protein